MFQKNLNELSILASSLPQDSCDKFPPDVMNITTMTTVNVTSANIQENTASTNTSVSFYCLIKFTLKHKLTIISFVYIYLFCECIS